MNLRKAVMEFLKGAHGSDNLSIYRAIISKCPEVGSDDLTRELDDMVGEGVLKKSPILPRFRINNADYCYWLPEYYRPTTE